MVIEKVIFASRWSGLFQRVHGRGAQHLAVDQRLPAQERQIETRARFCVGHQQIDGAMGLGQLHVLGDAAELALLGVAIGAAEIAFLGNRQRKRAQWRGRQRRIIDEADARSGRPGAAARRSPQLPSSIAER